MNHSAQHVAAPGILVNGPGGSSKTEWHFTRDNQRFGPVSWNQLKHLASRGQLLPTDLLWKQGMDRWVPAGQVKESGAGGRGPRFVPAKTSPAPQRKAGHGKPWSLLRGTVALTVLLVAGMGFGMVLARINEARAASSPAESRTVAAVAVVENQPAPKTNPTPAATAKTAPVVPTKVAVAPVEKAKSKPAAKAPAAARTIPVAGTRLDAAKLARLIDQEVQLRLETEGVKASPVCDDSEFLRRVYLDIAGVIPPADKAVAFLDSTDPNKRAKLIEDLLANPLYGKQMSEIWTSMLVPRESNNRRLQSEPLRAWLEQGFNANKPWNKLVHELVTATGAQDKNGAVTFFIGNPGPDKLTDTVTRLFLGVQLQCAQCHNHPFTSWKQTEYWGMAAFFMKVSISANPNQAAKKGITPEVTEIVGLGRGKGKGKAFKLPESAKIVPAKFFRAEEPRLKAGSPLRPVLADWMTSAKNPFFARAMANRMWHHFFGRGIVNPVDDMHDDNEASHPELLAALAEQFKVNGFDVKYLIRAVCNSETYQRTSRPYEGNGDDKNLFSHMAVRSLSAEQLYDSLAAVVGKAQRNDTPRKKGGGGKKGPTGPREQFINFFVIDEGANPLEYQSGIPQALRLMNSAQSNGNATVAAAMAGGRMPPQVVEHLYLTTLSRRPTAAESQRLSEYIGRQSDARTAYSDILWALANSSEFAMNH